MEEATFAEVLNAYLAGRQFTPRRLAEATDIPEDTIKGWLGGRGKTIREWQRALILAAALRLTASETRRLLQVAKVPLTALNEPAVTQAQAAIRNEHIRATVVEWYRDLGPSLAEPEAEPSAQATVEASASGAPGPLQPSLAEPRPEASSALAPTAPELMAAVPKAPTVQNGNPGTAPLRRRGLTRRQTLLGMLALAICLVLAVFASQSLSAKVRFPNRTAWGGFSDQDMNGSSPVRQYWQECLKPFDIPEASPIPGCIKITGDVSGTEGYLGGYYEFRTDQQAVDLSGMDALVFSARGNGNNWHAALEIKLTDPAEIAKAGTDHYEYHAPFTPTKDLTTFNLTLTDFKPFENAPPLDLSRISVVSWALNGGPQPGVELWIDQVAFVPKP